MLVPLFVLGLRNGIKLLQVYVTKTEKYGVTKGKLLTNDHRKYNNHATYQFSYDGSTFTGSDGSIVWGSVGQAVSIYFEKNNTGNNGIISGLIFYAVGQWLLFMILGTYVSFKIIRKARTP